MENKNIKILIIDDIQDNLTTLQALIEEAFSETSIFQALNGVQGIEIAKKEDPDVILLDIVMPGMDGFEVCQKLKKDKDLGEIPVVFVTALKGDKESRIRGLEFGAEGFLAKPIDRYELIAQIQAMVKIRNASKYRRDENKRLAELVLKKTQELTIQNKARQESEEKFKYIFDNSLIGKSITLPSGRLQVNKAMSAMLGYSESELNSKKWQEITHLDDIEFIEKKTAEVISGKIDSMHINKRYIKKDGSILWADLQTTIRRDIDGHPIYFITSILDITDKMTAQKSLQQSEENYRLLITQMTQGLAVHEVILDEEENVIDYRFIDVNHGFEELTGLKREDILGKTVLEVLPGTEESWIKKYGHVAMTGEPLIFDNYSKELGKYYEVIAYSPKLNQFATIFTDITKRKQSEERLKQQNEELIESQRIAHIGTWRWDLATDQVFWTEELYKMYNFDPKLPPPHFSEHMKLFTPDSWEKLSASVERARTSGIPYELELKTIKRDGSNGWMWVRGEAINDTKGNIIALWGATQDITEKKKIEENIKKQNEIMSSLLKVLPVGVFMVDAVDGKPLLANEMAKKLIGRGILPDANLENLSEVYKAHKKGSFDPYPMEEMPLVKGKEGEDSYVDDMVVERPDGTEVLLEIYGTHITDDNGKTWASLVTFSDITERTREHEDLEQALKFNQDIINSSSNGIIVYDTELCYKTFNPFMENLSGISAQEVIGRKAEEVFPWLKESGVIKNLEKALEGLNLDEIDFAFNLPETEKSGWARDQTGPLYNRSGDIVGVLGVVQDITGHKKSEDLLKEMNKSLALRLLQTINAISKIGELRDVYTAGHQKKVADLACAIAKELGLSEDRIGNISSGALIHDIGKINIASDTLNKPGKISNLEYQILQTHAECSYEIVKEIDFPPQVIEMIHQHHERLDGSGYPQKLAGDQIILESRILAVADVVEAMTSHRPYRPALGIDVALEEISLHRGEKYDCAVVDACVKLFKEKGFKFTIIN